MDLRVNPRSDRPIYLQIVDAVKHQIALGELAPGSKLPTVREMARALHVNFNTVARAYDILDRAGIISTEQGRGTYVRQHVDDGEMDQVRSDRLRALIGHAVIEALSLGYPVEQVRGACEEALRQYVHLEKS